MSKVEKVEIVTTVKFGKGRENTYYKGRILTGGEITPDILRELSAKTGTVRILGESAGSSVGPTPTTEIKGGLIYVNGVCKGRVAPLEEDKPKEEEKPEEDDPQSAVTRRKTSGSN